MQPGSQFVNKVHVTESAQDIFAGLLQQYKHLLINLKYIALDFKL